MSSDSSSETAAIVNLNSRLKCVTQTLQTGTVQGDVNIVKSCETIVSPHEIVFASETSRSLTLMAHDLLAQNRCEESQVLYQRAYELETELLAKGYLSTRLENTRQCLHQLIRFEALETDAAAALEPTLPQSAELSEPETSQATPVPEASTSPEAKAQIIGVPTPTPEPTSEPTPTPIPTPTPEPTLAPTPTPEPTLQPEPGQVRWQIDLKAHFNATTVATVSNPVLLDDQTLLIWVQLNLGTSQAQDIHSYLLALDDHGQEKWRYDLNGAKPDMDPVVGPSKTIYLAWGKHLYAFYPDGTPKWTYSTQGMSEHRLSLDSQENLYLMYVKLVQGVARLQWLSLNAEKELRWSHAQSSCSNRSPLTLDRHNRLYVNLAHCVESPVAATVAFDARTGEKLWTFEQSELSPLMAPAVGPDGSIYTYDRTEKTLYSLSPQQGTQNWQLNAATTPHFGLAVGPNGHIYFGALAAEPNGQIVRLPNNQTWGAKLFGAGISYSAPLIGADGMLYYHGFTGGLSRGGLSAIAPDGSLAWSVSGAGASAPALAPDGTLFFVTDSPKHLLAVQTRSQGLADSPWPRPGGNAQNSGQALF